MRLAPDDVLCALALSPFALWLSFRPANFFSGNAPPLFHCFDKCPVLVSMPSDQWPNANAIFRPLRFVLGNLAAWSHGSCVVYPSTVFDAAAIVDAVVEEKCSVLHGVPTHFLSVLTEVEKRQQAGEKLDFSRLR